MCNSDSPTSVSLNDNSLMCIRKVNVLSLLCSFSKNFWFLKEKLAFKDIAFFMFGELSSRDFCFEVHTIEVESIVGEAFEKHFIIF